MTKNIVVHLTVNPKIIQFCLVPSLFSLQVKNKIPTLRSIDSLDWQVWQVFVFYQSTTISRQARFNLAAKWKSGPLINWVAWQTNVTSEQRVSFARLTWGCCWLVKKRKLVKPVNRAKRRDFISSLQGKQRQNKANLNYFRVYNWINNDVLRHWVKLRKEGTRQNKQNSKDKSNKVK